MPILQLGDGKSTGNRVGCVSGPKRGVEVGGGAHENARARIRRRAFDKYPKLEFAGRYSSAYELSVD